MAVENNEANASRASDGGDGPLRPPGRLYVLGSFSPGGAALLFAALGLLLLGALGATRNDDPASVSAGPLSHQFEVAGPPFAAFASPRLRLTPAPDAPREEVPLFAVAISDDGETIVAVGADDRLRIRDATGERVSPRIGATGAFDVTLTPDGAQALVADAEGGISLVDLASGQSRRYQAEPDGAPLYAVVLAGRNDQIVAAGASGLLRQIALRDMAFTPAAAGSGAQPIQQVAPRQATQNQQQQQQQQAPPRQQVAKGDEVGPPQPIYGLAIDDAGRVITASGGGIGRYAQNRAGTYSLFVIPDESFGLLDTTVKGPRSLANRDTDNPFAVGLFDGDVAWSLGIGPNGLGLTGRGGGRFSSHIGPVYSVQSFTIDRLIASAGADGVIRVSNLSGAELARYDNPSPVHDIALSGDDATLAFVDADGRIGRLAIERRLYLPPVWALLSLLLGVCAAALFSQLHRTARANIHADNLRRQNRRAAPIAAFLDSDGPLTDPLNAGKALNALSDRLFAFMRNPATATPVTFALTGAWGSGKSSAMRLLQRHLDGARYPTIWFNAWHHQKEEHLFASLMAEVRAQATPSVASFGFYHWRNLRTRARLMLRRLGGRPLRFYLVTAAAAFILALALIAGPKVTVANPASAAFGLLGVLGPAAYFIYVALDALRPFQINPSVLIASTRSLFRGGKADARLGFRDEFARGFHELTTALGDRRLTIFIDDLDRCRKEQVVEVLEAVNFLVSSGDCYVVMGVSEQPVKNAIGLVFDDLAKASALPNGDASGGGDLSDAEKAAKEARDRADFAERYLEKLINLKVAIPPFDAEALSDWLAGAETPPPPESRLARLQAFLRRPGALAVNGALLAGLLIAGGLGWRAAVWSEGDGWVSGGLNRMLAPGDVGDGGPAAGGDVDVAVQPAAIDDPSGRLQAAIDELFPGAPAPTPGDAPAAPADATPTFIARLTDPFNAQGLMFGLLLGAALAFAPPSSRRWLARPGAIEARRESDAFADAMADVLPQIFNLLGSPRAIKRFVNRMRFLTAGISNEDADRIRKVIALGALVEIGVLNLGAATYEYAMVGSQIIANQMVDNVLRDIRITQSDWDDFRQLNAGVRFSSHGDAPDEGAAD